MRSKSLAFVCSLVLVLLAAGCGGGDGSGTLVPTASPGGIWEGSDSSSGLQVTGIVDEAGQFHFIRSDLVQFVGMATTSANAVTASFDGFTQVGDVFGDGSTHGTGTLSGTIAQRSTLALSYHFTTDAGTASSGTLNLSFNSLYNVASSLSTLAGSYTDATSSATVTVSSSGAIASQDATTMCAVTGQLSIINSMYNAYDVTYTYSNCTGTYAVLNGVQFSGLATLNNGTSPVNLVIAVTGEVGSTQYALVIALALQ
jgi:hypothetical protein